MIIEEIVVEKIVIGDFAKRKMFGENLTEKKMKEKVRKVISGINYVEDKDFEIRDEKYLYIININGDTATLICLFTEDEVH